MIEYLHSLRIFPHKITSWLLRWRIPPLVTKWTLSVMRQFEIMYSWWDECIMLFAIVWPNMHKVKVKSLSSAWLFATPWTVAYQAPLSMGFSRQEYWSQLPLPSPRQCYTMQEIADILKRSKSSLESHLHQLGYFH